MTSEQLRQETEQHLSALDMPTENSPLYRLESANRNILSNFLAVLILSGRTSDIPSLEGAPSKVLARTGLAKEGTTLHALHARLSDQLDEEQRATLLQLLDGALDST